MIRPYGTIKTQFGNSHGPDTSRSGKRRGAKRERSRYGEVFTAPGHWRRCQFFMLLR